MKACTEAELNSSWHQNEDSSLWWVHTIETQGSRMRRISYFIHNTNELVSTSVGHFYSNNYECDLLRTRSGVWKQNKRREPFALMVKGIGWSSVPWLSGKHSLFKFFCFCFSARGRCHEHSQGQDHALVLVLRWGRFHLVTDVAVPALLYGVLDHALQFAVGGAALVRHLVREALVAHRELSNFLTFKSMMMIWSIWGRIHELITVRNQASRPIFMFHASGII